jgi:NADH dehydrogenase
MGDSDGVIFMEKVLLTGATGFLGGYLAKGLTESGYSLRCLVRKTKRVEKLNNLPLVFSYGDLEDKESLKEATRGVDIVIHSASVISSQDVSLFEEVNVQGTKKLVAACEENLIKKFILISSVGASFHSLGYDCLYGNSKLAQEEIVKKSKMKWIILRPSFMIGQGGVRNFCKLIDLIRKSPFVPVLKGKKIQPVYVGDVVTAVLEVMRLKNLFAKTYTIAGRDIITISEFVRIVSEELKLVRFQIKIPIWLLKLLTAVYERVARAPILTVENLARFDFDNNYDIAPAIRDFGFRPSSIREGIRLTVKLAETDG